MNMDDLSIIFDGETVKFEAKHLKERVLAFFERHDAISETPYAELMQSKSNSYWINYAYREKRTIVTQEGNLATIEDIFQYLLQWYVQDKRKK